MTDTPPLTPEAPDPTRVPTLEEAKAELAKIEAWLQQFQAMQNQHAAVLIRAGELRGVIVTHEQYAQPNGSPNRATRRAAAKPKPKPKRT